MQVILLEDVRGIGQRGDVVRVKPGFARNYLIPHGRGLAATAANQKFYEAQKKKIDLRHSQKRDEAAARAAEIAGLRVTIAKRVGESETLYGSVTAADIAAALEAKGVSIDKRRLSLHGAIKTLGEHIVHLDLHPEVVAEVQVTVVAEE
ncbi:MAG: 50S ribosomal protein L9 [Acidobacteriota bacterium]|nr:50S ribosomal protein L9 [Acidobacteriota bacterium]MDH3523703.1 50S ribosomal protein L9 [Acidobacteriota bacterium]